MASQIPGYFFDEEKRRYFKILPNHQAPQGAKYSKEALKTKAQKHQKKKKHSPRVEANMLSRIQASAILEHPLGGGLLRREHGADPPRAGEAVYNAWASGLERNVYVRARQSILSFAMDKETGTFLMAFDTMFDGKSYLHVRMPHTPLDTESFLFRSRDPMLTSVNLTPSRFAIATSGDRYTSTIAITKLLDKDNFLAWYHGPAGLMPNNGLWWLRFNYALQCFVTAPKPDPTVAIFVAGGSRGSIFISAREGEWHTKLQPHSLAREVTTVDWLDHNTYLTGERGGAVRLWDIRSEGMSLRFQFPVAINHVKKLGEQRIAVAGMENKLMTYDLRSAPTLDADGMSLPYMTFGTYRNREFNGFSVSMDVHDNLIAASTDDRQVQLFNGASGQEIPNGSHNGFCNSGRQAMCLRFADKSITTDARTGPKLYVSGGSSVQEWKW